MTNTHPSYFALDRFALGEPDETTRSHVAACPRCAEYVESVQPTEAPMPLALHRKRRSPRAAIALGLLVPLVAAAAALFYVRSSPPEEVAAIPRHDPYVGVRGTPAIGVYVRRGNAISLWDGNATFSPGDTIRVKVIPEGFEHVRVFAVENGRANELYSGRLVLDDAGESLLPPAWQLDAEPGSETIVVVLGRGPAAELSNETLARDSDGTSLWVRRFVLPKGAARGP